LRRHAQTKSLLARAWLQRLACNGVPSEARLLCHPCLFFVSLLACNGLLAKACLQRPACRSSPQMLVRKGCLQRFACGCLLAKAGLQRLAGKGLLARIRLQKLAYRLAFRDSRDSAGSQRRLACKDLLAKFACKSLLVEVYLY
jgi:hypothetical protein